MGANGGRGDDDIADGRGGDHLYGGQGDDRLSGGSGADTLWPGEGFELHSCGAGRDKVQNPGSGDLVERDCETLGRLIGPDDDSPLDAYWRPYPVSVAGGRAVFEVACLQDYDVTYPCGGSITLTAAGGDRSLLGRARFPTRTQAVRRVGLPLTRRGRRLAGGRRGVLAVVSVRGPTPPPRSGGSGSSRESFAPGAARTTQAMVDFESDLERLVTRRRRACAGTVCK